MVLKIKITTLKFVFTSFLVTTFTLFSFAFFLDFIHSLKTTIRVEVKEDFRIQGLDEAIIILEENKPKKITFQHKEFIAQKPLKTISPKLTHQELTQETFRKALELSSKMSKIEKPELPVRRILWWSTVYGAEPSFFGIGASKIDLIGLQSKCKFKKPCEFTVNKTLLESSHGIIFHGWGEDLPTETIVMDGKNMTIPKNAPPQRHKDQMYIFLTMESPTRIYTNLQAYKDFFNWTITYRLDSDFPITYGRFERKSQEDINSYEREADLRDLQNRPKLVAWMVSNCNDETSGRRKYVQELEKHISINIYGTCGNNSCNSSINSNCWDELGMFYKFYLSFENSLCQDYVTEKFFNAIGARMVPIVMGKANYGLQFPAGSFINVDSFPSAKALAHYLVYLDSNDEEYLRYFDWRKYFSSSTYWYLEEAYCGVCERLHKDPLPTSVLDISQWLFRNNSEVPGCVDPLAMQVEAPVRRTDWLDAD